MIALLMLLSCSFVRIESLELVLIDIGVLVIAKSKIFAKGGLRIEARFAGRSSHASVNSPETGSFEGWQSLTKMW